MDFLVEVMSRMEVTQIEPGFGKLDKKNQRAIAVELADTPEEDGEILRSLKPGFIWRERMVRPEEVVVKKVEGRLPGCHVRRVSKMTAGQPWHHAVLDVKLQPEFRSHEFAAASHFPRS